MFCQNCGKSDQPPNSYCRQCGEFISDPKQTSQSFGGNTLQQNTGVVSVISLSASVSSLLAGFWMFITQFNVPIVLYFGAAVLICNAIWHFSNFIVVRKMRKRLNLAREENKAPQLQTNLTGDPATLQSADTNDLISPLSVTENTTRHLQKEDRR